MSTPPRAGARSRLGLSAYYLVHFAVAGALYPYLGVYLLERGFRPAAIGETFAALSATKLVAPYAWGWLADRFDAHLTVVRWTSVAAAACFAGFVLEPPYHVLLAVLVVHSFFWNAMLPQVEALTLSHLGRDASRYPRIRVWGSVGYILTVAGLGAYFEVGSVGWLGPISLALMSTLCLAAWLIPRRGPPPRTPPEAPAAPRPAGTVRSALASRAVLAFLGCCLLMQASHGTYYAFYTVYLQEHGYRAGTIGLLWALGVVSEIALFVVFHRVLNRVALRPLILACFVLTGGRWLMLAHHVELPLVVVLAQVLHAVSYGAFHAISILLIGRYFPGALQGRGQAIYASVSFGLGGAAGSLASGYLWGALGGAGAFTCAALLSFLAGLVAWRWVR